MTQGTDITEQVETGGGSPQRPWWRTPLIVLLAIFATVAIGYWVFTRYLFPTSFTPVELSEREQQRLDQKLQRIGIEPSRVSKGSKDKPRLEAEPYSEVGADREVFFSEKEINAMLAHNTDLADKLAIDLSDNLASAKLLIDVDPEFPVIGGKTLRVTAGLELQLNRSRPRAMLKGVSVWGVPLPNAWLGNLKNVDLIGEFGNAGGFWQAINDGVEEIQITDGKVRIKLKE